MFVKKKKVKTRAFLTDLCECRNPVLEKASREVWDLILENGGLGKEITDTIESVFCRLSGIDMMPPPPSTSIPSHQERERNMAADGGEKSKEIDTPEKPSSSSRKRPYSDTTTKGAGAVPNGGATSQHDGSEDSSQK